MYLLTNIRTQTHNDYACVLLFIVGFFGVGMQVGMDKMFGPDTPLGPMMKYWTVKSDNDFRRWLLGFREGIIIESPTEFVEEIKSNISKLGEIYKTKKN